MGSNYETGVNVFVDKKAVAAHETFTVTSLLAIAPEKSDAGYTLKVDEKAVSVKVQVLSQLTAYDKDNAAVALLSGITFTNGTCYNASVTGGETVTVMSSITDVKVISGLTESGSPEYKLEGGTLYIYTNATDNYITGYVRLGAYQYDDNGALISSGILDIAYTPGTPGEDEVTWTVK